jgi:hypothetical protein
MSQVAIWINKKKSDSSTGARWSPSFTSNSSHFQTGILVITEANLALRLVLEQNVHHIEYFERNLPLPARSHHNSQIFATLSKSHYAMVSGRNSGWGCGSWGCKDWRLTVSGMHPLCKNDGSGSKPRPFVELIILVGYFMSLEQEEQKDNSPKSSVISLLSHCHWAGAAVVQQDNIDSTF